MLSAKIKKQYRQINVLMLVKVMGWLVMIESFFMLIPFGVSLLYHESDWRPFLFAMIFTLACGFIMSKAVHPRDKSLSKREGFLLTASVWIVFSLFGMLPFILCATPYPAATAFTEAMSGLTTTGATILDNVECLSHGIKMWRSLLQWIGGMGIILFTLAVIPMLNHSGGMQMFNAEVTGITHGKLRPRISQTAKSLWTIYIILTGACVFLLWLGPMNIFEAVNHAFSTIATGGFSIYNDGIEHYHSNYIKIITAIFMLLGSVNFALIFSIALGRFSSIAHDKPLRYLFIFIGVFMSTLLISRLIVGIGGKPIDMIVDTMFMTISSLSSTSFTVAGFEDWGPLALGSIMIMMFIGGCAGSTSGGAKVDRIVVMLQYVRNEIWRALQPNSISSVKMGTRTLKYELVDKVIAFLLLDALIIILTGVVLTFFGIRWSDGLFSGLTCISNSGTGIEMGVFGGSLVGMPGTVKIFLSLVMLTGRLEIYTILVLFTRMFWYKA